MLDTYLTNREAHDYQNETPVMESQINVDFTFQVTHHIAFEEDRRK